MTKSLAWHLKRSASYALALWKVKRRRRWLVRLVWPELARTLDQGVSYSRQLDEEDAMFGRSNGSPPAN